MKKIFFLFLAMLFAFLNASTMGEILKGKDRFSLTFPKVIGVCSLEVNINNILYTNDGERNRPYIVEVGNQEEFTLNFFYTPKKKIGAIIPFNLRWIKGEKAFSRETIGLIYFYNRGGVAPVIPPECQSQ